MQCYLQGHLPSVVTASLPLLVGVTVVVVVVGVSLVTVTADVGDVGTAPTTTIPIGAFGSINPPFNRLDSLIPSILVRNSFKYCFVLSSNPSSTVFDSSTPTQSSLEPLVAEDATHD